MPNSWREQFDNLTEEWPSQGLHDKVETFIQSKFTELIDEIPVPTEKADMSLLYLGNNELKQQLKDRWL